MLFCTPCGKKRLSPCAVICRATAPDPAVQAVEAAEGIAREAWRDAYRAKAARVAARTDYRRDWSAK